MAWLQVEDGGRFEVRRVLCIGRNYAAHAREMGADGREPPCWFDKWPRCVLGGAEIRLPYPPRTTDLQHEVELVVAFSGHGANLGPDDALDGVAGYAVGLDMTRRDLQRAAKERRHPWTAAKSFEGAAPVSVLRTLAAPPQGRIWLTVNGALRQDSTVAQMVWSVPELLAELSTYGPLWPGDLVFTGTPAGVGPVVPGDVIEAGVEGLVPLRVTVGPG